LVHDERCDETSAGIEVPRGESLSTTLKLDACGALGSTDQLEAQVELIRPETRVLRVRSLDREGLALYWRRLVQ
jgi:hypothetical protein